MSDHATGADEPDPIRGPRLGTGLGAAAVLLHPGLWPTALRQWWRVAERGWWRRPPFLPRPDPVYLRFRLDTQYGSGAPPERRDLVVYLAWCRERERARHRPDPAHGSRGRADTRRDRALRR